MKSLFVIMFLISSSAFATPKYNAKFKATYPEAKALQKCMLCHGAEYSERNDYGKDFSNNGHDFKAIEGFDSDVDGFTNIAEINAGTFPGNVDSHKVDLNKY